MDDTIISLLPSLKLNNAKFGRIDLRLYLLINDCAEPGATLEVEISSAGMKWPFDFINNRIDLGKIFLPYHERFGAYQIFLLPSHAQVSGLTMSEMEVLNKEEIENEVHKILSNLMN